ncbi:MAG: type II toxin-antitoxin system RelE/ParE family toxin [bacterium]|nr:type II toxin-antitoxin system RelE/ParE family toxin [bacterium]
MKVRFAEQFDKNLEKLPPEIKRKFKKQLSFLLRDIRYPSLRSKKREELGDVWQARVDDNYRFFFQIQKDVYLVLNILKHSD